MVFFVNGVKPVASEMRGVPIHLFFGSAVCNKRKTSEFAQIHDQSIEYQINDPVTGPGGPFFSAFGTTNLAGTSGLLLVTALGKRKGCETREMILRKT